MIISLHLPKTAGSSFAKSLEEHFGAALLKDYGDFPINTPEYQRNKAALQASLQNAEERDFSSIECIHGHFLPLKYLLLSVRQELKFVTWMRDPVQRMLSHYYFWKRTYNRETSARLHCRVVEENWSVERFCLSQELRDIYKQFLWGFPLEKFDFIGIIDHYQSDFIYFCKKYLGVHLEEYKENIGDKSQYLIDEKLYNDIKNFHRYDMDLYKKALTQRLIRDST